MIQIQELTKDYGSLRAVNRISFQVQEGEILGFLGPNGAGKSTTLRIMTSYLTPTSGNIFINDMNAIINDIQGTVEQFNTIFTGNINSIIGEAIINSNA